MGRNLGPLNIKDSYEGLVQISGSDQLTDGSGSLISSLNITASDALAATTAVSSSHAVNADTAISSSYSATATSSSYADTSISASHATQADNATTADTATSASHAVQADNATTADTATSASYATTASYAENSVPPFPYVGNAEISGSLGITGSFAVMSGSVKLNDANTTFGEGTRNLFMGPKAGESITTGPENVVIGPANAFGGAGELLSTGEKNVVIGAGNAKGLTTGNRNILIGHGQIQGTSFSGNDNVYIGDATARDITSGNQNVRIGRWSGYLANGGNNNVSVGTRSGWRDLGSYNIIIGDNVVGQTSPNYSSNYTFILGSDVVATDNLLYGYHGTASPRFLNISGSVIISSASAYLEFPDGTKQYTAGGGGGGDTSGLVSGSGFDSLASQYYTTTDAIADDSGSIAIGNNALATGSGTTNTIVIGNNANSKENAPNNVIIGANAYMNEPNRNDSVIIGAGAHGYQEGVGIGSNSFAIYQAVAVGKDAYTNDNYGVAVGAGARTNNNGGIAIGSGSLQDGDGSIAIGKGAHATAQGDVVINNSYADVYTYDSSSNTTTLEGILAIDGIADVSASIAAGGAAFPYIGDAEITGSLKVEGWLNADFLGASGSSTDNMFLGIGSGDNITTGIRNVAIGSYYSSNVAANLYSAGYQLTQGSNNTLIGNGAACRLTTGQGNVAVGQLSLGGTTTGQENTAIGPQALRENNGSYNVGIGKWAGYNANGQSNVYIGYRTGFQHTGWRSVILGPNAIGQGAPTLTTHDWLIIGQDSTPEANLISGKTAGDKYLNVSGSFIVSGSISNQVNAITPASSTGSMDCNLGNMFTMTLDNGTDVRLESSNIKIGQTINLKLTNNATSAGTISFGPEFTFEGGTPFTATATTNAVDVMTFVSFDGSTLQATGLKNFS